MKTTEEYVNLVEKFVEESRRSDASAFSMDARQLRAQWAQAYALLAQIAYAKEQDDKGA